MMTIIMLFQFHIGTIKRQGTGIYASGLPNFNSTLVRLKDLQAQCDGVGIAFQFHIGTIKSSAFECCY